MQNGSLVPYYNAKKTVVFFFFFLDIHVVIVTKTTLYRSRNLFKSKTIILAKNRCFQYVFYVLNSFSVKTIAFLGGANRRTSSLHSLGKKKNRKIYREKLTRKPSENQFDGHWASQSNKRLRAKNVRCYFASSAKRTRVGSVHNSGRVKNNI